MRLFGQCNWCTLFHFPTGSWGPFSVPIGGVEMVEEEMEEEMVVEEEMAMVEEEMSGSGEIFQLLWEYNVGGLRPPRCLTT